MIARKIKAALSITLTPPPAALTAITGPPSRPWVALLECGHEAILLAARQPKRGTVALCEKCPNKRDNEPEDE